MKQIHTIKEWLCQSGIILKSAYVLYDGDFYEVSVTISEDNSSIDTFVGLINNRDFSFSKCQVNTCVLSGTLANKSNNKLNCLIELTPRSRGYSSFGLDNTKYEWYDNFCFTKIKSITIYK